MTRTLILLLAACAASPAAAQDPHAAHRTPAPAADPHAGHRAPGTQEAPGSPAGAPVPVVPADPGHAADSIYDPATMAAVREDLRRSHGGLATSRLLIDVLEVRLRDGRAGYAWEDVQFRYGGDIDRLWIKSRGEGTFADGIERAEVQALWSRAVTPFFDLQAGVRYDIRPRPDRGYLVLGVQGLAPRRFEVDAAAFLSENGDISARFEAEYDQRITQKLILQPRAELDVSLERVPELDIGSGLSTVEAGLRLRYAFVPEFAPYLGVQYERAIGDTADLRREAGKDRGGWSFLIGLRGWF